MQLDAIKCVKMTTFTAILRRLKIALFRRLLCARRLLPSPRFRLSQLIAFLIECDQTTFIEPVHELVRSLG